MNVYSYQREGESFCLWWEEEPKSWVEQIEAWARPLVDRAFGGAFK